MPQPVTLTKFQQVAIGTVVNQVTGVAGQPEQPVLLLDLTTAGAPPAASGTFYLNAHAADGSTQTINKAPTFGYARNVQIVASGADTATVTIKGLDINGYAISETLTLNGATPVVGKKAYSKVLTVTLPTTAATTVSVGTGALFGVPMQATAATNFLALVDGAADSGLGTFAVGGTSAGTDYYGTWTPATAPNGTHKYLMYYIPTSLVNYGVNN